MVAVADGAPLELAVIETAVALETVAGGEYVVLVPVVADRLPTSGLKVQVTGAVPSVSVAVKLAEPVPAVSVAFPGEMESAGVFGDVGQAIKPKTPMNPIRSNFKFFIGCSSVWNRNNQVSLLRHKTKLLRPLRNLELSDWCEIASTRGSNHPHCLEMFGCFMRCLIEQFNVAFFSQNRCPLLERALARCDRIAR